jgi:hypothetical protein
VEAQTRELDAMLADVRDMMQPEEWLETIQRDEQGFPTGPPPPPPATRSLAHRSAPPRVR